MAECRYYRVAGLDFSITAEAEPLALLTNYAPFSIDAPYACDLLFDLRIGDAGTVQAEPVFTDTSDDDMPRIEILRQTGAGPGDWLFRIAASKAGEVCMLIRTSADFRQAVLQPMPGCDLRFAIDNAAMLLYAFTTAGLGVLEMHASVTVMDGVGYLFLGYSGTGKSTHSRLWKQAYPEAWLLNDDNPVLRLLPEREVRIYGSPWSGKTPCYHQASAPVGGIVHLRQAPANSISRLRLPEAYAHMLSSCSGLKIQPEMMDALYNTIARVIQTVQVYQLDCLPDTDAARLCHDTMTN